MAKVLVIEDDKDIRRNLGHLLVSEGHGVDLVGNGQEALDALRTMTELPSVIILDLMMPVMDGFKFREHQTKDPKLAEIPVLIMTADGRLEEKRQSVGASMALRKPADIDAILAAVTQLSSR